MVFTFGEDEYGFHISQLIQKVLVSVGNNRSYSLINWIHVAKCR